MASRVEIHSRGLYKRLDDLAGLPRSNKYRGFRDRIRNMILAGHSEAMLAGLDVNSRPFAPLNRGIPLTRAQIKKRGGDGPPLVPRRSRSRFITNFRAAWSQVGESRWELSMYFEDIESKKGYPFAIAHLVGVPSRNLPRRIAGGIRRATWAKVDRAHYQFLDEVTRPD
jgi:hypothetical protein